MCDIYGKSFLIFLLYSQPFQAFTEHLDMLFSTSLHLTKLIPLYTRHTAYFSIILYSMISLWTYILAKLAFKSRGCSCPCFWSVLWSLSVCVCVCACKQWGGILYWLGLLSLCCIYVFSGYSGGNTRFAGAAQHSEDTEASSCRKQQLMSSVERGYWFSENTNGVNWTLLWPVTLSRQSLILQMAVWGKRVMNMKKSEMKWTKN